MEGSGSADNIAKLETRLAELEEELRRKSDKKRDEIQELLERARDAGGDRPEDVVPAREVARDDGGDGESPQTPDAG